MSELSNDSREIVEADRLNAHTANQRPSDTWRSPPKSGRLMRQIVKVSLEP